jgi:hypothetical protein
MLDEDRILFQKRLNELTMLSIHLDINITTDRTIDELENKRERLGFII